MQMLVRRLNTLDLELDPVTLLEMMNAPVEGQQEFKLVFGCGGLHIMSPDDMIS